MLKAAKQLSQGPACLFGHLDTYTATESHAKILQPPILIVVELKFSALAHLYHQNCNKTENTVHYCMWCVYMALYRINEYKNN